jgi:hypothetical protein
MNRTTSLTKVAAVIGPLILASTYVGYRAFGTTAGSTEQSPASRSEQTAGPQAAALVSAVAAPDSQVPSRADTAAARSIVTGPQPYGAGLFHDPSATPTSVTTIEPSSPFGPGVWTGAAAVVPPGQPDTRKPAWTAMHGSTAAALVRTPSSGPTVGFSIQPFPLSPPVPQPPLVTTQRRAVIMGGSKAGIFAPLPSLPDGPTGLSQAQSSALAPLVQQPPPSTPQRRTVIMGGSKSAGILFDSPVPSASGALQTESSSRQR